MLSLHACAGPGPSKAADESKMVPYRPWARVFARVNMLRLVRNVMLELLSVFVVLAGLFILHGVLVSHLRRFLVWILLYLFNYNVLIIIIII